MLKPVGLRQGGKRREDGTVSFFNQRGAGNEEAALKRELVYAKKNFQIRPALGAETTGRTKNFAKRILPLKKRDRDGAEFDALAFILNRENRLFRLKT